MEGQKNDGLFESNPETETVLKTFSAIKSRLERGKQVGLTFDEEKATKFARSDFKITNERMDELLTLIDHFTETIISSPGISEQPRPETGDVVFTYDQDMIELEIDIPDTTDEENPIDAPSDAIHLKYYTDGMHDIDLTMDIPSKWVVEKVPEGEIDEPTFQLKVTFDSENDPTKALTYNSGYLPFGSMTEEEAEIIKYYLKETIETTKRKPKH